MSLERRATPPWIADDVCTYCPSLQFGLGEFDVAERPDPRAWPWNPERALRLDAETGVGVCVHPHKVRLPVGRYASEGTEPDASGWDEPDDAPEPTSEPPADAAAPGPRKPAIAMPRFLRRIRHPAAPAAPAAPEAPAELAAAVPDDPSALGRWIAAQLHAAAPEDFADTLAYAEAAARTRHPDEVVVAALRDALGA
ncbi:hypothetical protein [Yinghuangia soli]|uniref:Uncharacterized protein n=1 Tax=Yinghuangia soli TaxID=2908204 RepID=A0AA41Q8Y3_9ACTN|nr:hypothetical protein [Yinghuangia soli]MCF2532509.1 hypothetical protein [Yinghuangia soli]